MYKKLLLLVSVVGILFMSSCTKDDGIAKTFQLRAENDTEMNLLIGSVYYELENITIGDMNVGDLELNEFSAYQTVEEGTYTVTCEWNEYTRENLTGLGLGELTDTGNYTTTIKLSKDNEYTNYGVVFEVKNMALVANLYYYD